MIRSRFILLFCLSWLLPGSLYAQDIAIRLRITTDSLRSVAGATIHLVTGKEHVLSGLTDAAGTAGFTVHPHVTYAIDITAGSYAAYKGNLTADSTHTTFSFALRRSRLLEGATVTAAKPIMRQDGDVTIVDPEGLAAASTSSYEILEKTPGVVADPDGNFYMTSATPAMIYINGREMKMSAADIAAMLKALPPNSIQRIELMRTPSAKFDASGGGGIINIVLKKGVKIGLTGSANAGAQQGVYGNQNAGLNMSYGDGDRSAYLNLNLASRKSLEHTASTRVLDADSLLSQDAGTVYRGQNIYLGYGIGKTIRQDWELSYDGRVNGSSNNNYTDNESIIARKSTGAIASDNMTSVTNAGRSWNIDQSVDAKYKIDTAGSEWTVALNWNGSFGNSTQDIFSRFLSSSAGDIRDNGDIVTQRHYGMLQSDLKYKLPHKLAIEAGIKSTVSSFRHNSDYHILYNGSLIADPLRSTTYRYTENINAAYGQVTKEFGGHIIIKPGLRMEHTNMDGAQTRPGDTSFSIHRTDLFPYLYISKPIMRIKSFELRAYLVYRKTIQRPSYDYLNPFQRFVDQYLYETGNPTLRPQFTHNYEFNISADEHPVFAIGYNDVQDAYANVVYESELNPNIVLRTWDNLGRNRELYVRGMGGVPPGGTYFFIFGGQYNLNDYDGYYNGEPLQYRRESFTFFTYHNLKLGRKTNIIVNGFMRLKGVLQFYELGTFGSLNASINRHFFDRKLALTISAQDIFYTNRYDATIDQGGITGTISRYKDSQRFGMNLRYNFGWKRKEDQKDPGGENGDNGEEE